MNVQLCTSCADHQWCSKKGIPADYSCYQKRTPYNLPPEELAKLDCKDCVAPCFSLTKGTPCVWFYGRAEWYRLHYPRECGVNGCLHDVWPVGCRITGKPCPGTCKDDTRKKQAPTEIPPSRGENWSRPAIRYDKDKIKKKGSFVPLF